MRSGRLRLVGVALAAAVFWATGCDNSPRGGDPARTETTMSGGTAAGADPMAEPESPAATPPVNPGPDSSPVTPKVDTAPRRSPPPVRATRDTGAGAGGAGASAGGGAPAKTVTQVEYTGWKQYEVNCARCHGEYGLGSTIAPSLYHSFKTGAVDSAEFQRVVHGSRMPKGMPNWTGVLSEEYLHAIYKYLSGRGAGRIGAGRPTPEG